MRKSRFATVWLISPSTSSSQKHYNLINFSYQPFPKHTPESFSSCTLLTLSPLSDLASFHLHLFKPTHPSRPSSMPLLYEISRSTQPQMSFLSTETATELRLYLPHGALHIPNLTKCEDRIHMSCWSVSFLITKIMHTCYNNYLHIINTLQIISVQQIIISSFKKSKQVS